MKRVICGLGMVLALCSSAAFADELEDNLTTVWESLWHETGTPMRLTRWGKPIQVRLSGLDLEVHREHTWKALHEAAALTGLQITDISDQDSSAAEANFTIEFVNVRALNENQGCITSVTWKTDGLIDKVAMKAKSGEAWRCMYHEIMHAMGVMGHPIGKTVLSYFPWRRDNFMPMDALMLRSWYSPAMKPRMSPLQGLVVVSEAVVQQTAPADPAARTTQQKFLQTTFAQMEAYAEGRGEVPPVVKRSGRSSTQAMQAGQLDMSYFVGMAYADGTIVPANSSKAAVWFERTARQGHSPSQILLARLLEKGDGVDLDLVEAYKWFSLAATQKNGLGKPGVERIATLLSQEQLEEAQSRVTAFK